MYCSSDAVRVISWRRVWWEGHGAGIGDKASPYGVLVAKPEERDHSEHLDISGGILFKWIFKT